MMPRPSRDRRRPNDGEDATTARRWLRRARVARAWIAVLAAAAALLSAVATAVEAVAHALR
jgi:hypothetical protein